jgi:hypothetical protein
LKKFEPFHGSAFATMARCEALALITLMARRKAFSDEWRNTGSVRHSGGYFVAGNIRGSSVNLVSVP